MPILSLNDVLTVPVVENMLAGKLDAEIAATFGPWLPKLLQRGARTDVLEAVRSAFFQQAAERLSEGLRGHEGAGYLLCACLHVEYQGEGIEAFLEACRTLGRGK